MGWKDLRGELEEEFAALHGEREEHWKSVGLGFRTHASAAQKLAAWRMANPERFKAIQARYWASEKGRATRARARETERARRAAARAARPPKTQRTDARDARVLAMLAAGMRGKDVAAALGMHASAVSVIRTRAAKGVVRQRRRSVRA